MESLNQSEGMKVFNKYESEVRSYVRSFPTVFTKAKGCKLWDVDGKEYIDFLSGAGALNYGHNPDGMKEKLIEYIQNDGVAHSLDMATTAKEQFLKRFNEVILEPRSMDYKIMFPGPTGTNTVESALKLARKVTGRSNIISFTNGFHGMTIGALSVTGNSFKRQGAGIPLTNTTSMPFDNFMNNDFDTVEYLEQHLDNQGSGMDKPAAIILETVQGEGGINAARFEWMKQIEQVCRKHDILLIIDDVQAGCGRTGTFFSFEPAGIEPDIICLSKSIGGYGQPFAITLFKPKYDIWKPGEHNGTFRGNNFAFIAATEAMTYWEDNSFIEGITKRADKVSAFLEKLVKEYPELKGEHRGRGLMQGIAVGEDGLADKICEAAFEHGLIMETSGPDSEVFKLFPPLNVDMKDLEKGLSIIEEAIKATVKEPVKA